MCGSCTFPNVRAPNGSQPEMGAIIGRDESVSLAAIHKSISIDVS